MGLGDWLKDRAEIKAIEKEAFEDEKDKADAEKHRKALEEAKISGKERAHNGRKLPKPNPEKIAAIKSVLGALGDRAAAAGERVNAGEMFEDTAAPQRKPNGRNAPERKSPQRKPNGRNAPERKSPQRKPNGRNAPVKKTMSPEEELNEFNKKMKETLGY